MQRKIIASPKLPTSPSSLLPVQLPLGPGGCPAGERWTVSSWGSQFPLWHGVSGQGGRIRMKEGGWRAQWSWLTNQISVLRERKQQQLIIWLFIWLCSLLCFHLLSHFSPMASLFGTLFLLYRFSSILGTCWCLCSSLPLLPFCLSRLTALRQGHSGLGTPLLHSHSLWPTPFHTKSLPLLTFLSDCIGWLRSGMFCSSLCTDGRVRMTKTRSLSPALRCVIQSLLLKSPA